jgi:hypothetical protein
VSAAFKLRGDESDVDILEDSGVFVLQEDMRTDTNVLAGDAIRRALEDARLAEDVVFPPLPPPPEVAPRRDVAVFAFAPDELQFPTPGAIVKSAAVATGRTRKTARHSRWPVYLCAFVAIAAGTASFLTSPAGRRPEVVRVTSEIRLAAWEARQAALELVR